MTLDEMINRGPTKDFSWFFITNFLRKLDIPASEIPLRDEELIEYLKEKTKEDPSLYKKLDAHIQEFWVY